LIEHAPDLCVFVQVRRRGRGWLTKGKIESSARVHASEKTKALMQQRLHHNKKRKRQVEDENPKDNDNDDKDSKTIVQLTDDEKDKNPRLKSIYQDKQLAKLSLEILELEERILMRSLQIEKFQKQQVNDTTAVKALQAKLEILQQT
jgi:hypothetical protein